MTQARVAGILLVVVCAVSAMPDAKASRSRKPGGSLSGVVLTMSNQPLAGVTVQLEPTGNAGTAATATTDAEGEFAIELHAGQYSMRLTRDGLAPFEGKITIPKGQQQTVRVQMLDAAMGRRNEAIKAYNAGAEAYRTGDQGAAIAQLEASVEADSTLAEPWGLLASLYFARDSFAQAAAAAESYLLLEPDDREMQERAYRAYMKTGNQTKIDSWRERLARTGASRQFALDAYNEGALALENGDLDRALERFRMALKLEPALAEANVGIASIHYEQDRADEALAAVERALALSPRDAKALRLNFLIHDEAGRRTDADAAIEAYAAVEPAAAAELLVRRAEFELRAERYPEAEAAWLKVLEIDADHARAHFNLGVIYASVDTAKARGHLERFLALAPDAPQVGEATLLLDNL